MPAVFERHRMGPLSFEVIRKKGLVTEVTVSTWDPKKALRVKIAPRLQPVDVTLTKILEDLFASASDAEHIRSIARGIAMDDEARETLMSLIDWADENKNAIAQAFKVRYPEFKLET